jgi:hypothetical protein
MWRAVNPLTWRLQGGLKLPDRGKRDPAAEAECVGLLRLPGHGRHGLQSMQEHLRRHARTLPHKIIVALVVRNKLARRALT